MAMAHGHKHSHGHNCSGTESVSCVSYPFEVTNSPASAYMYTYQMYSYSIRTVPQDHAANARLTLLPRVLVVAICSTVSSRQVLAAHLLSPALLVENDQTGSRRVYRVPLSAH